MTVNEAKLSLLERSEDLVRHELARRVRQLEEEARTEAKRRARNLVADALQRVAASHAAETTVSVIELPSDDMKGRIIGREGRNIRALEHLTGVDFIIDDTPQAVVLSSFDGIRREVARLTLSKLIEDGRIHPARIEDTYYAVEGRDRGPHRPGRRTGCLRGELRRVPRGARQDPRPVALPDELRPERSQAHARGRAPCRDHGVGGRCERQGDEARRAASRRRQGDDARGRGLARVDLRAARTPLRRDAARRPRDRGPPLRGRTADGRGRAADRGRRDLGLTTRCARREPRALHQAARVARGARRAEARRRQGVRAPGRTGDSRDRTTGRRRRRRVRCCSHTRSRARSKISSSIPAR